MKAEVAKKNLLFRKQDYNSPSSDFTLGSAQSFGGYDYLADLSPLPVDLLEHDSLSSVSNTSNTKVSIMSNFGFVGSPTANREFFPKKDNDPTPTESSKHHDSSNLWDKTFDYDFKREPGTNATTERNSPLLEIEMLSLSQQQSHISQPPPSSIKTNLFEYGSFQAPHDDKDQKKGHFRMNSVNSERGFNSALFSSEALMPGPPSLSIDTSLSKKYWAGPSTSVAPPMQNQQQFFAGPKSAGLNNNGMMYGGFGYRCPADQNPPCNTLYVGNLPHGASEMELRELFQTCVGYKRMSYKMRANGPMVFVEFESIAFATHALTQLHGVMLSCSVKGGIRLSFSKNPLGVRLNPGNSNPNGYVYSVEESYGM